MAEKEVKKFDRSKPHISIGGIGHVDHGKTTLIAAITKRLAEKGQAKFKDYGEIDKAPEERKRGITISTSHVEFETNDRTIETDDKKTIEIAGRHYTWIDCPGHKDYIKNMITGAAQMDGAIVVVAADDSVKDQTKEHVLLAKQVGIKHLVVFINKADISDPETMEFAEGDIQEILAEHKYDDKTPIVKGSALCALQGSNPEIGEKAIDKLLEAIDCYIPNPQRNLDAPFKLYIEDVLTISGRGTVVTGRVEQGTLKKGEEVQVSGLGGEVIKTVATGIEMYHKDLEEAQAGDDVGINLRGVKREQVKRGQILTKSSKTEEVKSYSKFTAAAYILSREERGRHTPFHSGYSPQFYFKTADVTGTIKFFKEDNTEDKDKEVEPGSKVEFMVELTKPVVIDKLENFIIREGGFTVGRGTVLTTID